MTGHQQFAPQASQKIESFTPAPPYHSESASVWLLALRLVRRRLLLIVLIVLLVVAAAVPLILAFPRVYQSNERVMITPSPAMILAVQDADRNVTLVIDTEIERILSDHVLQQVVDTLGIAELPEFAEAPGDLGPLRGLLRALRPGTDRPPETALPGAEAEAAPGEADAETVTDPGAAAASQGGQETAGEGAPAPQPQPAEVSAEASALPVPEAAGQGDASPDAEPAAPPGAEVADEGARSQPPGPVVQDDEVQRDLVMKAFREHLSVVREGASSVVTISFASKDPELAMAVPKEVVATYLANASTTWQDGVTQVIDWLSASIDTDLERITESRATLETFIAEAGLDTAVNDNELTQRLTLIDRRQAELNREQLVTEADQTSVEQALADIDLPARSESEVLRGLRFDLVRARQELEHLSRTYNPHSVQVREQTMRVALLEGMIRNELTSYMKLLRLRAQAQQDEADALAEDASEIRTNLATMRAAEPVVRALRDTLRRKEEAVARLETRHYELRSQAQIAPVALEILVPSVLEAEPLGPSRKLYLLGAVLAGGLLALGVAVIAELRDTSVRSHAQLTHIPRLVPVGLWPRFSGAERGAMPRLIATHSPGRAPDALRDAITLLECGNERGFPAVLSVTAPEMTGKSLPVAEWIALELVAKGYKVRIVDAVSPPSSAAGSTTAANETSQERGPERLNLAQLVESAGCDRMTMLRRLKLEAAKAKVIVIVDAPPLMEGQGLQLAREGGAVLLVLRWGSTRRVVVELLASLLGRVGVHSISTLIVEADPRRHRLYGFEDRLTLASLDTGRRRRVSSA